MNWDSEKAAMAALLESLENVRGSAQPAKVGQPCPYCGRPLEALWHSDTEPLFICCPPCEQEEHS